MSLCFLSVLVLHPLGFAWFLILLLLAPASSTHASPTTTKHTCSGTIRIDKNICNKSRPEIFSRKVCTSREGT